MATVEQISTPDGSEARLYDDGDGVVALSVMQGTIPVHGQALADALARLGYTAALDGATSTEWGVLDKRTDRIQVGPQAYVETWTGSEHDRKMGRVAVPRQVTEWRAAE